MVTRGTPDAPAASRHLASGARLGREQSANPASPRESREVSERIRGSLLYCTWLLARTRGGKSTGVPLRVLLRRHQAVSTAGRHAQHVP